MHSDHRIHPWMQPAPPPHLPLWQNSKVTLTHVQPRPLCPSAARRGHRSSQMAPVPASSSLSHLVPHSLFCHLGTFLLTKLIPSCCPNAFLPSSPADITYHWTTPCDSYRVFPLHLPPIQMSFALIGSFWATDGRFQDVFPWPIMNGINLPPELAIFPRNSFRILIVTHCAGCLKREKEERKLFLQPMLQNDCTCVKL